jgi:hypothetical protein
MLMWEKRREEAEGQREREVRQDGGREGGKDGRRGASLRRRVASLYAKSM